MTANSRHVVTYYDWQTASSARDEVREVLGSAPLLEIEKRVLEEARDVLDLLLKRYEESRREEGGDDS